VVLQHDRFNRTALNTVVVAMLTSQLRYEAQPGNVRLRKGEAGLPKASVVNVTQIATWTERASPPRSGACPERAWPRSGRACAWC
jgi:mRNA interferase MazF